MKTLLLALSATLATLLAVLAAGFFVLRAVLAPLPGEWSVPIGWGPLRIQAGVPSAIRLATSWWGGPLLHGRRFVGLMRPLVPVPCAARLFRRLVRHTGKRDGLG